ncbi:MAG: ribosomal protein S18-alanine N-acetyltransferase [Armatimonadetes bacterium]|nr:ribosomal protein S18-alanine N-acetyltransferase [Armatimonadota bacterium]
MCHGDIPAVMVIERQCFTTPWSENAYRTELSNQCAEYYVAWMDGQLVGYIGMWLVMDEVHVTTLGVAEQRRGMRIGERLLVRVLDAAREREAQRVTLEVRKSNDVARSLYKKYGFREAAIRKGYYSDNQEDAIIMWVDDLWAPEFSDLFEAHRDALSQMEEY